MLTLLHYRVIMGNEGEEIIAVVLKHNVAIDTISMHRSMPKMSEIAATRAIGRMEGKWRLKRRSPIVAVTAIVGRRCRRSV
jgi:CheY-like chemotaxis protein